MIIEYEAMIEKYFRNVFLKFNIFEKRSRLKSQNQKFQYDNYLWIKTLSGMFI